MAWVTVRVRGAARAGRSTRRRCSEKSLAREMKYRGEALQFFGPGSGPRPGRAAARRAGRDLDEHLSVGWHERKRLPAGQRGSLDQAAGGVLLAVQARCDHRADRRAAVHGGDAVHPAAAAGGHRQRDREAHRIGLAARGGLLVAAVANFFGVYMRRYRGGKMALDVQHEMRTELFESLSNLDGARQDEIHTGQLVGRSISDINMVQGLLQWMPLILGSSILFIFSLVIMIILSPLLSLVAIAVAPALADRDRLAQDALPRQLARAAGGRRGGRHRRRVHRRRPRGQGLRPGRPGDGAAGGTEQDPVRLPASDGEAHRPVQPGAHRVPVVRPGRRAAARRLAGDPRQHHARHLPRVLQLPRPAGRPVRVLTNLGRSARRRGPA